MIENKKVDENWKENTQKEKTEAKNANPDFAFEPDFKFFVTTLGLQASVALGLIPNPANNKKEEDLKQAKLVIDTLDILKTKTKGNLDKEESQLLENMLYELRMQFVAKSKK